MVAFTFQELLTGGPASYMTGISDMDIRQSANGPVLYASSGPDGGISSYRLTATGAQFMERVAFQPGQIQAVTGQTEEITLNGQSLLVTLGRHDTTPQCIDLNAAGEITGTAQLAPAGGFPAAIVSMKQVTLGGQDFIYTSLFGINGISVYKVGPAGQLLQIGHAGGAGAGPQSADLIAMRSLDAGGNKFLLTLSAQDNALTTYRIGADGIPVEADRIDATTGLSIAAPTGLVETIVDGVQYLVAAAAGSSSLSVLEMDGDGMLIPVDHVTDDLNTRFQGVTALETVTVGDRVYLVAGGSDDGLSLFTLLPGGRLQHLTQIADSNDMALTNIAALSLTVISGVIQIYASGGGEAGITHLTVNPGTLGLNIDAGNGGGVTLGTAAGEVMTGGSGNDKLRSLGGDDILIDGAGSDNLRGGAGADTFVFVADGERDTVEDFELGIDRLDLSGLGLIYSMAQLSVVSTNWGVKIYYGAEEIRLYSADGNPIDPAAFQIGDLVNVAHYPVGRVTPEVPPQGTPGPDQLQSGSSDDILIGLAGNDLLEAGAGADLLDGGPGRDTLRGGNGSDTLKGGIHADLLEGGAGNDALWGEAGHDTLRGGDGADTLDGGILNDWLFGGADNDSLNGAAGDDQLFGEDGDDRLFGDVGNDLLFGGAGNDTLAGGNQGDMLRGGAGDDQLFGEDGDDRLFGDAGNDLLFGGDGNDTLGGGGQNDVLRASLGNDRVYGEDGDDSVFGDNGFDALFGGAGNDTLAGGNQGDMLRGGADQDQLFGENGNDTLLGDAGDDALFGGAGRDTLAGGAHNDSLYGGADNDRVLGGYGHDTLDGGAGHDTLNGGFGNDLVVGGAGFDVLTGHSGNDTLTGGLGADVFIFGDAGGTDIVTDFDPHDVQERLNLRYLTAITDLADLRDNHLRQSGGDAVIDAPDGTRIVLRGIDIADLLDGNDFIF